MGVWVALDVAVRGGTTAVEGVGKAWTQCGVRVRVACGLVKAWVTSPRRCCGRDGDDAGDGMATRVGMRREQVVLARRGRGREWRSGGVGCGRRKKGGRRGWLGLEEEMGRPVRKGKERKRKEREAGPACFRPKSDFLKVFIFLFIFPFTFKFRFKFQLTIKFQMSFLFALKFYGFNLGLYFAN